MKIVICNEIFRNWKFKDVFDNLKISFDGIEIAPSTISDDITTVTESKIKNII